LQTGIAGEPSLPYFAISLLLPPGEVATSIKFIGSHEVTLEGTYTLFPYQSSVPLSQPNNSEFLFNKSCSDINYPGQLFKLLKSFFVACSNFW
jgi:hypothetical protein